MHNKGLIAGIILVFLVVVGLPLWYGAATGKSGKMEKLDLPADKKQCVEPTPYMRAHHVDVLSLWKETVVREGKRTYVAGDGKEYTMSLTNTCIDCHKNKEKFCDRCHNYVGAKPRCWECHTYPKGT